MVEINSFDIDAPLVTEFMQVTKLLYADDPLYRDYHVNIPQEYAPRLFVAFRKGELVGRIAALDNRDLSLEGQKTGLFGFFDFIEESEVAAQLLDAACCYLKSLGCSRCVGPINGNTWQSYRVTLPDENPPLFLDNYHKPYYYDLYKKQTLEQIASYITTRIPRDKFSFARVGSFSKRLRGHGVTVRPLNLDEYDGELHRIHTISRESFVHNFLYSPISFEQFKGLYIPVRDIIDPEFVLLAEDASGPVGFVFGIQDQYNTATKSLIIKTLATVQDSRCRGLGGYLTELLHKKAHEIGFQQIFHLLMHSSNISTKISASASQVYRRYALFGKSL